MIRSVDENSAEALLEVYRQCEDFLSLGPVPKASMAMVLEDLKHSREMSGDFCGIYIGEELAGVVDFVTDGFEGEPGVAFLSLLMIAGKHRGTGLGCKVVEAVEAEILREGCVRTIFSGVQANNGSAIHFWLRRGYRITGGLELMPDLTICYSLRKDISGR